MCLTAVPDGGDGGSGGDVWLVADRNVSSLLAFRDYPHRIASSGTHGQGAKRHGKRGEDMIVSVPEGTTVKDHESGEVLADLVADGDRWLAGPGGQGGRGNARFLANKRRAPAFAEQGEKCEDTWYRLELKLMADVALVGFPSAGKSTLISVMSRAKPKIADYPFTTLEPNLGVVRVGEQEFVMADLPGLIEGASEGAGLGDRFLRHIERARVLVYLIDLSSVDGATPREQLEVLRRELGSYQPNLMTRPSIVVGSKSDMLAIEDWGEDGPTDAALAISSITNQGIDKLGWKLLDLVSSARNAEPERDGYVIHRPEATGVEITRDDDGAWRVLGRAAERSVALSDLTDVGALDYAQHRLQKLGVNKALKKAGVRDGDEVRIGTFAFEYEEDM